MTILVNGVEKELTAIGRNDIEWTLDLIGGNDDALQYDEDKEQYTMSEEAFEWWQPVVEMVNEIHELEEELDDDVWEAYEAENFAYADFETGLEVRLEWLKSHTEKTEHEKLSLQEFIDEAMKGNGVQNDSTNVWVEVNGEQYTVKIDEVLDHEEKEPFEASYTLEGDRKHDAWEEFYKQYLKDEGIK